MEPSSNTNDALEKRDTRRHPIILVRSLTSHACTISFFVLSRHLWHIGLGLRKQVSVSISFPLSVTKQRSTEADGGPSRIASHHQARRHKTARHLEDECKIWFLYQKEGMDDTTTFSTLQFVFDTIFMVFSILLWLGPFT
jgi:hypothetical protein